VLVALVNGESPRSRDHPPSLVATLLTPSGFVGALLTVSTLVSPLAAALFAAPAVAWALSAQRR
jgi:hypothetical protein